MIILKQIPIEMPDRLRPSAYNSLAKIIKKPMCQKHSLNAKLRCAFYITCGGGYMCVYEGSGGGGA